MQPVLPGPAALALWGVLALGTATMLFMRSRTVAAPVVAASSSTAAMSARPIALRQAIAAVLALVGVLQIVGAASGANDPLRPLERFTSRGDAPSAMLVFKTVRSVDELDAVLRTAGRPAMLDFYADWCVSCKEMERFTFSDAAVQKKLAGALLLKADVTANNDQDRELLKRFQLFGPPGTIFFDARGDELRSARLIGYQNSDRFLQTLSAAGL